MDTVFVERWCVLYGLSEDVFNWLECGGLLDGESIQGMTFSAISGSPLAVGDQCMLRGALVQYRDKGTRKKVDDSIMGAILRDFPHIYRDEGNPENNEDDVTSQPDNTKNKKKKGKKSSRYTEPESADNLDKKIDILEQRLKRLPWIQEWERFVAMQAMHDRQEKRKKPVRNNDGLTLAERIMTNRKQSSDSVDNTVNMEESVVEVEDLDPEERMYTPEERNLMNQLMHHRPELKLKEPDTESNQSEPGAESNQSEPGAEFNQSEAESEPKSRPQSSKSSITSRPGSTKSGSESKSRPVSAKSGSSREAHSRNSNDTSSPLPDVD